MDPQVANRIRRMFTHRRKWARRSGVTCFRVYDHDIADQPFILDWYDGEPVVWTLTRTRNETPADEQRWVDAVRTAVAEGLSTEQRAITAQEVILKQRRRQQDRQQGDGQYHRIAQQGATRLVSEQGLHFEINLHDYLDTGLFLDHRATRALVREQAAGQRMLNLFAYTGSFTCYAAAGGAASTHTVDLSATYLSWAQRNLAHNQLAEPKHTFEKADCLQWLERDQRRFDLIVCDPPTFSNSTSMDRSWAVERDHPWLLTALHQRLTPGGVLWFSTNAKGFRLADTGLPAFATIDDCTARTTPEDFSGRSPHRCWRMTRA